MTRVIKIKLKAPGHTPGPWSAEPTQGGAWGATIRIWGGRVRSGIADVCVRRNINATGEPSAEEIANARLMAAAPDLFESLTQARAAVERFAVEEARANTAPTGLKPSTKWRDKLEAIDGALAYALSGRT